MGYVDHRNKQIKVAALKKRTLTNQAHLLTLMIKVMSGSRKHMSSSNNGGYSLKPKCYYLFKILNIYKLYHKTTTIRRTEFILMLIIVISILTQNSVNNVNVKQKRELTTDTFVKFIKTFIFLLPSYPCQ